MSKTLYDEAIAEAKLLKETAEQNAKNAIIEAVTPRIREFIEDQLIGSGSEENEDADVVNSVISEISSGTKNASESDDVILDESALESLLDIFSSSSLGGNTAASTVKEAARQSFDTLDSEGQLKLLNAANKLAENRDFLQGDSIDSDMDKKREIPRMPINDDEILYEVDLSELSSILSEELDDDDDADESKKIRLEVEEDDDELKEVLSALGFDDVLRESELRIDLGDLDLDEDAAEALRDALSRASVTMSDDEDDEEGEDVEVEEDEEFMMDLEPGEEGEEVEVDEEEVEDLSEVFEIDENVLRSELSKLRSRISEAKDLTKLKGIKDAKEASWGGSGSSKAGVKGAYGGTGNSKAGVKGAFGGGKYGSDALKVTLNKLSEAVKNERRRNRALKTRLDEYRSAVETLREQLTDLNLFNAKLLYVNKLLQNKDVTPSQKRTVVESIDKAKSLREVKLLYRSLTESFSKGSKRLSESRTRMVMGSSSRSTSRGSAEGAAHEVDRWATLAGLKNN